MYDRLAIEFPWGNSIPIYRIYRQHMQFYAQQISGFRQSKYLMMLLTHIRRPSHKIFGFCVAILAYGVITNALNFTA